MISQLRPALVLLGLFSLLLGLAYPFAVTGIAQTLFSERANGSLIVRDGKVVGSRLVGQEFADSRYFSSRPSATSGTPYNAGASSGSNLGPTNPALLDAVGTRAAALRESNPSHAHDAIPADLVTTSASGLDPHISPAAAYYQVERIATLRHIEHARLKALVSEHIETRSLGIIGEPRVNVLELNLALDALSNGGS